MENHFYRCNILIRPHFPVHTKGQQTLCKLCENLFSFLFGTSSMTRKHSSRIRTDRAVRSSREVDCGQIDMWEFSVFLPPTNEVWGKVIFSEVCVKNSVHRGGGYLVPGVWSRGVPGLGGLVWGVWSWGSAWSWGCLVWGGLQAHNQGEVEGDLVQAHNQGGI